MDPETGLPGALYLVARDGAWCELSAARTGRERSWRAGHGL
ncbi:MAG: hypothetical protein ACRDRH_26635 [Pseudonocardia sp.]